MIDEAMKCACGLDMDPISVGSEFKTCVNCDAAPGDMATARDQVFTKEWRRRVVEMYPRETGQQAA